MRFTAQIHPQDLSESCERQTKHVSIHRSYSEVNLFIKQTLPNTIFIIYMYSLSHALNSPLRYASYLKTDNYAFMENMQMTSLVVPTLSFMENIFHFRLSYPPVEPAQKKVLHVRSCARVFDFPKLSNFSLGSSKIGGGGQSNQFYHNKKQFS